MSQNGSPKTTLVLSDKTSVNFWAKREKNGQKKDITAKKRREQRVQDDEQSASEAARNEFDPTAPLAQQTKNPQESFLFGSGKSIQCEGK